MVQFSYLDKARFDTAAPVLFHILDDNMHTVAPTGNDRREDYRRWYSAVGGGLKQEARQILLIKEEQTDTLIGFFQYYTNRDTFMMEELQIIPRFQGRDGIFRALYGFVISRLPSALVTAPDASVQAYADKRNAKSIAILHHLGLEIVGTDEKGFCHHFKGRLADLLAWYEGKQ